MPQPSHNLDPRCTFCLGQCTRSSSSERDSSLAHPIEAADDLSSQPTLEAGIERPLDGGDDRIGQVLRELDPRPRLELGGHGLGRR